MTSRRIAAATTIAVAALTIAACGGESDAASPSAETETVTETVTETADHTTTVTETPDPGPEPTRAAAEPEEASSGSSGSSGSGTTFGTGTHLVGPDIQPGTYRNTATDGCYWERLSGTGGDFDDIITNGYSDGQSYVTIAPTDVAFDSSFCGTWELVE